MPIHQPMPFIQISTPFNVDIEFETAPFQKRLLAYILDLIIIIGYMFSMMYIFYGELRVGEAENGIAQVFIALPALFYTFLTELLMNGQTLGKRALNIKVISLEGGEPTLGQYLLRWFLRFYEWSFIISVVIERNWGSGIVFLFFGGVTTIIIIATNTRNKRLGDIFAGTAIVNTRTQLTLDDTIFKNISTQTYKVTFPEVMRLSDRDLNTNQQVINQAKKTSNVDTLNRVATKVQNILKVPTDLYALEFLEKLIEDYNYLATKENG